MMDYLLLYQLKGSDEVMASTVVSNIGLKGIERLLCSGGSAVAF
ncbi:hypothetical protein [Virgibacillus sp. JSM 102003]